MGPGPSTDVTIRFARPEDAPRISALYEDAYRPPGGGTARDHYPFPQFLSPDWVGDAARRPGLFWVVAERRGQVVGSAGMLRNIGIEADRIGEVFGIVVAASEWGRGIGSGLLGALVNAGGEAGFIICESRTALASGWKVARNSGFAPLGFEPFGHATPAGAESMLLTGRVGPAAAGRRLAGLATPRVRALAETVLGQFPAAAVPTLADSPARGRSPCAAESGWLRVVRDDSAGRHFLAGRSEERRHESGVVCLARLEGEDPSGGRFDRRYYVGSAGDAVVGCVRVVWDRVDQRVRILDFLSHDNRADPGLLAAVVRDLADQAGHQPLVLVVDVRAEAPHLQQALEQLGFRPTVYYPGLIARGEAREDAVQFTRLLNRELEHSLTWAESLNWTVATAVVAQVAKIYRS